MANIIEDNDEIGVARGLRRRKSSLSLKGVGAVFLIVVLVIGSFWLSFLIGKRVLSPIRQLPKTELPKMETYKVPEGLPVYDAPGTENPDRPVPAVREVKPVKKVVIKKDPFFAKKREKITKAAVKAKVETVKTVSGALYKVRTAIAESKEKAIMLMKDLKEKGFDEVFAHEMGEGKFSVQAGAFRSKANADKLVKELKEKGFDGKIITDE